jgi:hypothetical protein
MLVTGDQFWVLEFWYQKNDTLGQAWVISRLLLWDFVI